MTTAQTTTATTAAPNFCPSAHSSLERYADGTYYVRTTYSAGEFDALKSWFNANCLRLKSRGAKGRRYPSGKRFLAFDRSPSALYTDVVHEVQVIWPVQDQEAAEEVEKRILWGSYASSYASSHASKRSDLRDDLRALTTA
jgi:hypothetical protein